MDIGKEIKRHRDVPHPDETTAPEFVPEWLTEPAEEPVEEPVVVPEREEEEEIVPA